MGLFTVSSGLHAIYDVELQFRHAVMGGIPADPKIIEAWIRTKGKGVIDRDEELRLMMVRTLQEQGVEGIGPDDTFEKILDASAAIAKLKSTVGFKFDKAGLYLESRQVQAMLKENTNILFSDQRWGPTGKSPKGMMAENVSFESERIHMSHVVGAEDIPSTDLWQIRDPELVPVVEPSGIQLMIGHVEGASGKRSTLTYHQYCFRPRIRFTMMIIRNRFGADIWEEVWTAAEGNGLGAVRSQLFGTFDLVRFDLLREAKKPAAKNSMQYTPKGEIAAQEKAEKEAAVAAAGEEITTTGGRNGRKPRAVAETATTLVGA